MKPKPCPACEGGHLLPVDNILSDIEGYVFVERGERCSGCREEFPYPEDSRRMIEAARRLGVWPEPLKLYRKLSRSGRGVTLHLPADVERQLGLKGTEEVAISKVGRKIVVEILT